MAALNSDLTTTATLSAELGVSSADARLPRLISAASAVALRYLGRRQLYFQVGIIEKVPGLGRQTLLVDVVPIVGVTSVLLPDGSAVAVTDLWRTPERDALGHLFRDVGFPWTGAVRAGLLYSDPAIGTEVPSITVTYDGGWVTPGQVDNGSQLAAARSLPSDVEEAAIHIAVGLYRQGGADRTVSAESLGSYSVTYADRGNVGVMPASAIEILDQYRRLT